MQHIVITGGGAIGAAIAYFLAQQYGAQWQITVLERDPAYTCASSALSASSIRQQFSQPLNMAMSAFGWDFLSNAAQTLSTPQHSVDLQLCERGYLYLASQSHGRIAQITPQGEVLALEDVDHPAEPGYGGDGAVRLHAPRGMALQLRVNAETLAPDGSVFYTNGNAIYHRLPDGSVRPVVRESMIEQLVVVI